MGGTEQQEMTQSPKGLGSAGGGHPLKPVHSPTQGLAQMISNPHCLSPLGPDLSQESQVRPRPAPKSVIASQLHSKPPRISASFSSPALVYWCYPSPPHPSGITAGGSFLPPAHASPLRSSHPLPQLPQVLQTFTNEVQLGLLLPGPFELELPVIAVEFLSSEGRWIQKQNLKKKKKERKKQNLQSFSFPQVLSPWPGALGPLSLPRSPNLGFECSPAVAGPDNR